MKFTLTLSFTLLVLMVSCGDTNNPETSEEKTKPIKSEFPERLVSADAPTLPKKKISQDGWVGTVYDYRGDFVEVFEDHEILRTPPPGAGPEYKVKRDENDTGLIPVNMGRLRNRKDNSPFSGKIFQHFLSGELEHYANYEDGFRKGTASVSYTHLTLPTICSV